MMCERYWREGIVLVERGLEDPHRHGCVDCRRAHVARQELVDWLPLVGEGETGDPNWQASVWERIDAELASGEVAGEKRARGSRRWRWQLAGALAAACAVALWVGVDRKGSMDTSPQIEIDAHGKVMRSRAADVGGTMDAHVDETLRVRAKKTSEVWIYRAGSLVLRCSLREVTAGCGQDSDRLIAEQVLSIRGEYEVLVIDVPVTPLRRRLDEDKAALQHAGIQPITRRILAH